MTRVEADYRGHSLTAVREGVGRWTAYVDQERLEGVALSSWHAVEAAKAAVDAAWAAHEAIERATDACGPCEGTGRAGLVVHPEVGLVEQQCQACRGSGRREARRGWTPRVVEGGGISPEEAETLAYQRIHGGG